MIEIIRGVPRHAEFLHHAPRPQICRHGERYNLRQCKLFEPIAQAFARRFRGEPRFQCAAASRQPISTQGVKCASNGTRERPASPISSPVSRSSTAKNPKPCCAVCACIAKDHRVALLRRKRRRKELHDARIGVHPPERFAIALLPGAQSQSGRFQHDHFSLRGRGTTPARRYEI